MILTLNDVGRKDAGRYRCIASNGVGKEAIEHIDVKVMCK